MDDLNDPSIQRLVAAGMDSALVWLIGHEVAHHIKGHVDSNRRPTLVESRKFEAEADAWALERAFNIRVNPMPTHPILLFYSMTGISDYEHEMRSTHPASIRRYADFLDGIAAKERDTAWYRSKFGYEPTKEMHDELKALRERARRLVPE